MKKRREAPFYREHDPKPATVDAETHARLTQLTYTPERGFTRGTSNSIENLGGKLAERRHGGDKFKGYGRAFGSMTAYSGRAARTMSYKPTAELTLREVCGRLSVSRFTLWRMVKRGQFPAPLPVDKRRSVWLRTDVDAWCSAHSAHFQRVIARKSRQGFGIR